MKPLPSDHIRLLCIEPGSDDSPIRCRLLVRSLEASPPYEALSYTWGSLERDCIITCDEAPMFVTTHLYDVLQYLRKPEEERIMWIDALCINQRDDHERSEQVGIMKDIYTKAWHVVIWLGRETPEDKIAFELLDRFKQIFDERGLVELGPEHYRTVGLPWLHDPNWSHWTALVKLFQRSWFQRIWVVQEAAMAREATVVCGPYSIMWKDISNIAISVRKRGYLGPYPIQFHATGITSATVIHFLRQAIQFQNNSWGLLSLLRLTRKYKATDPRDKVFALMGVVTDAGSILVDLKPDYRLSTEEVYLSVALHYLEKLKNLELLAHAGINSALRNPKLPSWIPDWGSCNENRAVIAATVVKTNFCAAGDSQPTLSISADKKVLSIRGAVIDTISQQDHSILYGDEDLALDHCTEAGRARLNLRSKINTESFEAFAEAAYKFPEGHTREESLWRTLCCDQTTEIPVQRAPAEYGIAYKVLRKLHAATDANRRIDMDAFHRSIAQEEMLDFVAFDNTVLRHYTGKNLCVTTGGYLGIVPNGTLDGDKICILFGSAVPFVLREYDGVFFELVGECYIHGIMDGEGMREPDIETLSRDFVII
ncbi:hypothetical protein EG329_012690 [Mollisiaceae sp. DMI_Dod_QoI]|nr:hypothetical protein EG329_012690 [Helotiales sp. DMI_Dod_QoI]